MVTTYAETFDGIFRGILGQWPLKPHITRIVGGWVCRSHGSQGFGDTPQEAYRSWKDRPMVYAPNSQYEAGK